MEFVLILRSDDKICVTEIARAASHARLVEVDSDSSVRQHDELVSDLSDFLGRTKSVVFVNPTAGARRTERSWRDARGAFARMEMAPEFVTTASVAELEVRVRAAVADDARLLFAMGGDGTVQALAETSKLIPLQRITRTRN